MAELFEQVFRKIDAGLLSQRFCPACPNFRLLRRSRLDIWFFFFFNVITLGIAYVPLIIVTPNLQDETAFPVREFKNFISYHTFEI